MKLIRLFIVIIVLSFLTMLLEKAFGIKYDNTIQNIIHKVVLMFNGIIIWKLS
jgi:hypothetical protein